MTETVKLAKKYKKQLILGPMFKVIEVIFELFTPFLMKYIIDIGYKDAINDGNYKNIIIPGLLILLTVVLGFCSTLVCQHFSSIASQGYGTDLRNAIFKKTNSLSLREIELIGKGNILNLISNDSNRLQLAVAMIIRLVIRAPALVIGSLIMTIFISKEISLFFFVVTFILILFVLLVFIFSSKQIVKIQTKTDMISNLANDDLRGIRVIKAFNKVNEEENKFNNLTEDYYKQARKNTFLNALVNPITLLFIDLACVGVLLFAKGDINIGDVTLSSGDLVSLIAYLNQILVALIVVCNLILIFTRAYASKKRTDNFFAIESSIVNNPKVKDVRVNNGDKLFEFNNVSFKYNEGENNTVANLNFTIYKGETVGIIGGTGSGKSTIIKLMERFFDNTDGEIIYKNNLLKDYDLISLRNEVSLVDQKNNIFKGTIRENVLMGNKRSDEEVINSLKLSKAFDFVDRFDEKLDYVLEEGGKNLSGGQKQRICIARALNKHGEVLILDDSTSALDYLTDKEVRENIKKIDNLTTIIVSQRATSLLDCDKIIVMDKGTVESIGKHEDLLEISSVYKEIYYSQVGVKNE